ncbi:uncharacterized protein LOC120667022 [Panicum virgatum]|uniref:uncharacterized protein LOC120667022 n=1 Tax=Panicum virgatum TaxID=38727 RepID=UPI0019D59D2C|nr:uncharacterized protein LOC120667022 [Panicum virgatum]
MAPRHFKIHHRDHLCGSSGDACRVQADDREHHHPDKQRHPRHQTSCYLFVKLQRSRRLQPAQCFASTTPRSHETRRRAEARPGAATTSTTTSGSQAGDRRRRREPGNDAEAENGKHTVAAAPRARVTSPRPRLVPCLALTLTFDELYDDETFLTAPDAERNTELMLENINDQQQEFEEEPSQFSSLPKDAGFRCWFFLGLAPSQLYVGMVRHTTAGWKSYISICFRCRLYML